MREKMINGLPSRKQIQILLLIYIILVFSPIVFSAVIANLSISPSIAINNVIYEVNDQGDLTIQTSGIMTGISPTSCSFKIQIPDTFAVDTLTDGSPVIEMLSNGSVLEITEGSTTFGAMFALRTHNTTLLPKTFLFEMNSSRLQYSGYITPQWPPDQDNQNVGGGASITDGGSPYITSFYAHNSRKGQTEHVETYIYNPSDYVEYLSYLKFRIKAYDYWEDTIDNYWHDWTLYNENRYIGDHYTLIVHDYLANIFTASSYPYKIYALNKGDYDVTQVYAYGTGWSDTDWPTSNNDFNVKNPSSGMNVVFVTHLVDDDFRSAFDEASYFNDLEGDDYGFAPGSKTLKDDYDIDFISGVYDWDTTTTDIYTAWSNLPKDAAEVLGIEYDYPIDEWHSMDGTSHFNHGFDMLFGSSWITPSGSTKGLAAKGANSALVMKGNAHFRRAMHEVLHTFDCHTSTKAHVTSWGGYIMYGTGSPGWPFGWPASTMHGGTSSTLITNDDKYDGFAWS